MKIKEIASFLDGKLIGDDDIEILRIAEIEKASKHEISFIAKNKRIEKLDKIEASCLLTNNDFESVLPCPHIKVTDPKLAFAKIAPKLHLYNPKKGWHETASISKKADIKADYVGAFSTVGHNTRIGKSSEIREGCQIGNNVSIGKRSIIHSNCTIYDNVEIGNDCVIHSGTVIGADGFGYVRDENNYIKFPQIGSVTIEKNVEIGANSCIDRGSLGETRIGEGTKIDNLVQIAHNVRIGKRVVIAAQTGISGSVVIEDDCVIAGQVGFSDHCTIKSGAVIGAQAGVLPGKIVRKGVWWGTPVQPLSDYKRLNAHIKSLPRLKNEIRELKKVIAKLEKE